MKTILAVMMMVLSTTAYGQLVKCVSKDGKVEYTRECPPGTTEHKLRSGGSAPAAGAAAGSGAAPAAPQSLAERDAAFKKRQIEQQEAAQKGEKAEAAEKDRREACENARSYLKSLEGGERIRKVDPKTGERVFLEDAEIAKEATRARALVAERCK